MAAPNSPKPLTALALDVGERRIGVACANLEVRFASPLTTLETPERFLDDIVDLCDREQAALVVIGLPRSLNGQETQQTARVREFGAAVSERITIPVYWIDEALTSEKAEQELRSRGKSAGQYKKGEVDALAATYILEDFLRDYKQD